MVSGNGTDYHGYRRAPEYSIDDMPKLREDIAKLAAQRVGG